MAAKNYNDFTRDRRKAVICQIIIFTSCHLDMFVKLIGLVDEGKENYMPNDILKVITPVFILGILMIMMIICVRNRN